MGMEKLRFFCRKNHVHKIPRFKGGGILGFLVGGGGECRFYFYGRGDFSDFSGAVGNGGFLTPKPSFPDFGLRNRSPKSQIANDFPSRP